MHRQRTGLVAAALACVACYSSTTATGPGTTPPPAPPSPTAGQPAFTIRCDEPASFTNCGSSTCRVSAAEPVSVALGCTTDSPWLECGVGPSALTLGAGESRTVGVTLNSEPLRSDGYTQVFVVGTGRGQVQRADLRVLPGSSITSEPPPRAMTVAGCAGYVPGVLGTDQVQRFVSGVRVGAWRAAIGAPGAFCGELGADREGFFALDIPSDCVPEGGSITLSAGGLNTCVTVPFHAGRRSYAVLLGKREPSCP